MRRVTVLSLAAALTLVPLRASGAPPIDAAEFAAKCSTGTYIVGFDLQVVGSGTLTGDCFIAIAEDVTLSFVNATIDGSSPGCCALVVGDSLRRSGIVLRNTTIDLDDSVQLAAGCCAGDGEPGHPEELGTASVVGSFVRGTTVEVSASTADDFGRAVVRNSTLVATDGSFASPLDIRASVPGTGGEAAVQNSHLTSASGMSIRTDVNGDTVARNNVFDAAGPIIITTGPGGTCRSAGNTPAVPCT
jgi:hypothetical protein